MITKNLKRKNGQLALIIKSKRIKENKMKEFTYTITDPEGIHARPAGELVKAAKAFESAIKLNKEGKSADCKRVFGIMGLAVKQGQTVTVTVEGSDEEAAAQAMENFFKTTL